MPALCPNDTLFSFPQLWFKILYFFPSDTQHWLQWAQPILALSWGRFWSLCCAGLQVPAQPVLALGTGSSWFRAGSSWDVPRAGGINGIQGIWCCWAPVGLNTLSAPSRPQPSWQAAQLSLVTSHTSLGLLIKQQFHFLIFSLNNPLRRGFREYWSWLVYSCSFVMGPLARSWCACFQCLIFISVGDPDC